MKLRLSLCLKTLWQCDNRARLGAVRTRRHLHFRCCQFVFQYTEMFKIAFMVTQQISTVTNRWANDLQCLSIV
jgi:hypothetical protein